MQKPTQQLQTQKSKPTSKLEPINPNPLPTTKTTKTSHHTLKSTHNRQKNPQQQPKKPSTTKNQQLTTFTSQNPFQKNP